MITATIIIIYLFVLGFNMESVGVFDEQTTYSTFDRFLMVVWSATAGILMFPIVLGAKLSKILSKFEK